MASGSSLKPAGRSTRNRPLTCGRLQASKLALPKQGKLSPACKAAAAVIQQLVGAWGQQLTQP